MWELIGVVRHPLLFVLSKSRNMSLCLYGLCNVLPKFSLDFFLAETRKVFLSFFFLPKQSHAERQVSLTSKRNIFLDLDLKIIPWNLFPLRKKCFNCFDQIGFSTFLGTWLKTYQTKYFNELGHFWLDQNGFVGFLGTWLRATRSLWDLHRSWS